MTLSRREAALFLAERMIRRSGRRFAEKHHAAQGQLEPGSVQSEAISL
jgi:hypothetical protein